MACKKASLVAYIALASARAASRTTKGFWPVPPEMFSPTIATLQFPSWRLRSTIGFLLLLSIYGVFCDDATLLGPISNCSTALVCSIKTGNSLILKGTRNLRSSCFNPPSYFWHLHSFVQWASRISPTTQTCLCIPAQSGSPAITWGI